jgi:hypothetical protein
MSALQQNALSDAPQVGPGPPRRIAILGGAGAGKSTLARKLGEALDLPVIHLDRLAFGAGWRPRGPQAMCADLRSAIAPGAWIVEGTYGEASAITLPAADLVLWLDQPAWRRLWRTWRKTVVHRGRPRADRPDDCEEGFGWRYVATVLNFGGWSRPLARRLNAATSGEVRRVRGDAGARRLLAGLGARRPGSGG